MGAAQFASGLGVPQSSPVFAVGQAAIDLAPPQVKEFAIAAFGADDKTVLLGGILAVVALYAAVVGMLAVRRLAFGMWGLAIFAFIGLAAVLTRPTATAGYVVPTLVGTAAGAFALTWLARAAARLGSPLDVLFPLDPHPELTDLAQPADPARPAAPKRPPDVVYVAEPTFRAGPAYSATFLPHPDDQAPSRPPQARHSRRAGSRWLVWPGRSTRASPPWRYDSTEAYGARHGWLRCPASTRGGSGSGNGRPHYCGHAVPAGSLQAACPTQLSACESVPFGPVPGLTVTLVIFPLFPAISGLSSWLVNAA